MADSDSSDDEIPPWSEDEAQNISEDHEVWEIFRCLSSTSAKQEQKRTTAAKLARYCDPSDRVAFSRTNPLFELLGKGEVHAALLEAKKNRNVLKDGRRDPSRVTNDIPAWAHLTKIFKGIEAALLVALCLVKLEHSRNIIFWKTVTMRNSTLDSRELPIWNKARNLEAQEEKSRVTEEWLSSQEKKEENTRALLADLERHKEKVKEAKKDLAKIEKQNIESTKMLKTKTQLTKDKEKLAIIVQTEKESRNDDAKKALKAGERETRLTKPK
ncbi:hypothetical protein ABVK25_009557 [Lepraria finkii]|uniref:Uncharacterized protein n=1 Tax=Lepraria finkii TaxID=1340010 RepID=A0ABR4AZI0_9LECA